MFNFLVCGLVVIGLITAVLVLIYRCDRMATQMDSLQWDLFTAHKVRDQVTRDRDELRLAAERLAAREKAQLRDLHNRVHQMKEADDVQLQKAREVAAQLNERLHVATQERDGLATRLEDLLGLQHLRETQSADTERILNDLRFDHQALRDEYDSLAARNAELFQTVETARLDQAVVEKEWEERRVRLEIHNQRLIDGHAALVNRVQRLAEAEQALQQRLAVAQDTITHAEATVARLDGDHRIACEARDRVIQERDGLAVSLAAAQRTVELAGQRMAEQQKRLDERDGQMRQLWVDIADLLELRDKLQARVQVLEAAVDAHHAARGHARCLLNDMQLYRACKPGTPDIDPAAGQSLPELMAGCAAYWMGQLGLAEKVPDEMTVLKKDVMT